MTVNLTRIYTRLGDGGETHLGDMSRVAKTHPRIEAYGTVDELNAQIGVTLTLAELPEPYRPWLERIQNDLFDVGADIAAPDEAERERLRVIPPQTEWLEQRCDEVNATLAPLKSFVLPGGTAVGPATALTPPGLALFAALAAAGLVVLTRPDAVLAYGSAHKWFLAGAAAIGAIGLSLATGVMMTLRR